jgi:hypothetical protein
LFWRSLLKRLFVAQYPDNAAWQARAQAKYAIGLGVFVLVVAGFAFILYLHYRGDISAFESAAQCASPGNAAAGQHCIYKGQAQVLSTGRHDRLEATIEFDSIPARTFSTSFATHNEPSSTALSVGTTTDAEVWAGMVTRLAGKVTVDNPENTQAQPYLEFTGMFIVGGLVILGLSAGLARDAWKVK